MADFDYDRLRDSISQGVAEGLAGNAGRGQSQVENPEEKAERERLRGLVKELGKFENSLRGSKTSAEKWGDFFTTGKVKYNEVHQSLEALDEQIKETNNSERRRELESQRRSVQMKAGWDNTKRSMVNFTSQLVTSGYDFAKGVAGATKDIVSSLTSSGSDTRVFTGLFSAGVKVLTTGAQAAGQVFGSLGGVVGNLVGAAFPQLGRVISSIAGGLGKAFGALVGIVGSVAVGAFELLTSTVDNYIKSFQTMNKAGAVFAGGMGDMIRTANSAGLTIEQFSKVVSQSSQDISAAGLGLTDGARKLGRSLAAGGVEMQRRLLNLGYSVEEQATLVAETMRSMAGMAGPLKASDAEVARQTQKYAENLKIIAGITGEDAKKKLEQARQDMMNLRFQQQMNKLTAEQRSQVEGAMAAAPAAARKMAIEIANTGTIITPALAVLAQNSPEMKKLAENLADGAKTGNITTKQVADYMAANGETIRKSMDSAEAIATAGFARPDSLAAEVSKLMMDTMNYASKATKEAIDSTLTNIKEGAGADKTDPITNVLTTIQQKAQELRVLVEEKISGLMTEFGNALADNVTTIADGLKTLANALDIEGIGKAISGLLGNLNNLMNGTGSIFEKIKGLLSGGLDGKEIVGKGGKYAGMGIGAIGGYKAGSFLGSKIPDMLKGYQQGGIKGALGGVIDKEKPNFGSPDGSAANPYYVIIAGSGKGSVVDTVTGGPGKADKTPKPGEPTKPNEPKTGEPPKPDDKSKASAKPKAPSEPPKPGEPTKPNELKTGEPPKPDDKSKASAKPKVPGGGKGFGKLAGKAVGGIAGLFGGPVGAIVGGYLGGLAGEMLGELLYNTVTKFISEEAPEGRARGGPVSAQIPYIIGELGPELFVPGSSGSVVPNDILRSSGQSTAAIKEAISSVSTVALTGSEQIAKSMGEIIRANLETLTDVTKTGKGESTSQNAEMTNILREQLSMNAQLIEQQQQMSSIMSDVRSIQQQILNHTV